MQQLLKRKRSQLSALALGSTLLSISITNALAADVKLPPISVGAGVRTSFTNLAVDGADEDVNDFTLDSARIYLSGKVTENISLMFNTEYNGSDEKLVVMDAAAQFAFSDKFNIWAGRFLPPSDRANLYGPYYANDWGVYQDGVQDGFPAESVGRDDGVMYWGQFGILKVSAGVFDIQSITGGDSDVLYAGRAQLDFWDAEGGYYLNSTYYGEKDLLAVGVAIQTVAGGKAYTGDFLLEKKLGNSGVVTIEAEYAKYDEFGGYLGAAVAPAPKSDGFYVLGAYVFPQEVGIGKFQLLGKYGTVTHEYLLGDVDQDTLELNVNYLIKTFNARVSLFYIDKSFDPSIAADSTQIGLGLQVQL
jgi:hypothetical protein